MVIEIERVLERYGIEDHVTRNLIANEILDEIEREER